MSVTTAAAGAGRKRSSLAQQLRQLADLRRDARRPLIVILAGNTLPLHI
jgi:hypothetical protein